MQRRRGVTRPGKAVGPSGEGSEPQLERIRPVERSLAFRPETLRSKEEVDRYLKAARETLLRDLSGYDGIRIQ